MDTTPMVMPEIFAAPINSCAVGDLSPHPLNSQLYGESDTIEDIAKTGVIDPILITHDRRIISGHRRWLTAKKLGLESVPVRVYPSHDELDIEEMLVRFNHAQRERTNEVKAREYQVLKRVYHEKYSRQGNNQYTKNGASSKILLDAEKPKEKAAKVNNMTRPTADKAVAVLEAIDELTAKGKAKEAKALKEKLNKKSIHSAHKQAKERGYIKPPPPEKEKLVLSGDTSKYITLEHWQRLSSNEHRGIIVNAKRNTKEGFNEQKTNLIEWARWSWNPVTGCLHNCPYCYARDIAEKTYPQKFAPAFVPSRLWTPSNIDVPEQASENIGYKNVFVCSMADLFGKWVPEAWIEAVLEVVRKNKQWNFLFLTKFPIRLSQFEFPSNAWVGTTVDCQKRVENAERAFRKVHAKVKWLSCEPLLEPLQFHSLKMFDWVVLGGASQSEQTPEWRPPFQWIVDLWQQAKEAECQIYMKTNLLTRVLDYPGQPKIPKVTAKEFRYPLLTE